MKKKKKKGRRLANIRVCVESFLKEPEKNITKKKEGGSRGVMVIVVGNGHGDTSSNPRRDWLHFT